MLEAYADWTGEGARVPRRDGPGDAARGRDVRRGPVAGIPAAGAGRGVVRRAARVLGPLEGPLLRAVRARRRLGGGDPVPALGQLLRPHPDTSVHEAYPGHHWHLVMRKANPSDVRRVYSTPYFSEGWALYAERVMRERGFFTSPLHELQHLNATLFRAARIIVDTSLHLGEMTFEEAVAFMTDRAALPDPVARAEVGPLLLVADPGVVVPDRVPGDSCYPRRVLGFTGLRGRGRARCAGRGVARLPRRDRVVRRAAAWPGAAGRAGRLTPAARNARGRDRQRASINR